MTDPVTSRKLLKLSYDVYDIALLSGGRGGIGDADGRAVSAGDAHLLPGRRLHLHVDAVHRGVPHRVSHPDHRLAGKQPAKLRPWSGRRYRVVSRDR